MSGGPSLLVPLYVHPAVDGEAWQRAAQAGSVTAAVVVNVDSGPGTVPDAVFAAAVDRLHAAGVATSGYLDTGYGAVSGRALGEQAARWSSWYGVGGRFFDQVSARPELRDHCREVVQQATGPVRARTGPVVLNFGVEPHQGYAELGDLVDLVVTFEGSWADYRRYRPAAAWVRGEGGPRCAHLVHSVPPDQVRQAVARVNRWGVTRYGVSCGTGANPWDAWPAALVAGAESGGRR